MRHLSKIVVLMVMLAFICNSTVMASPYTRPTIMGTNGMVAVGHYLAAHTGNTILMKGGNAFDAGAAMILAQSVLEFNLFGLAGECPSLLYSSEDGKVYSVDGNTAAPKGVDITWFQENGIVAIPGDGLLAAGVPATVDAVCLILDKWGTMSLAEVAADAIRYADEGFPMHPNFRDSIIRMEERFNTEWPTSAAVFLPDGKVPDLGEIFVQKDLAGTLKKLVESEQTALAAGKSRSEAIKAARDRFYKGDIAEAMVKFQKENKFLDATGEEHYGNLTMEDFATYSAKVREPWTVNYRGYDVYKCGPWTQGPVFLQHLNLLEQFDLQKLGYGTADYWHVWIETAKLAHADKDKFYGDEEFVAVPKDGLLSKEYAKERVKLVDMAAARNEHTPGDPYKYDSGKAGASTGYASAGVYDVAFAVDDLEEYLEINVHDTTGTRAVDRWGNMFSSTPSGGWFTSSPIIPGVGVVFNTRIQMFYVDDATRAKAYIPGARPSTSLTPTLVTKDGKPSMVFGTPGGDAQDQYTLQTFLNVVDFGFEVQEAIDEPKLRSYNFPGLFFPFSQQLGVARVDDWFPQEALDELVKRGHKISYYGPGFRDATHMIIYDPETGVMRGGASPARDKQYVIGW